jgi:hypothetical protein
VSAVRAAGAVLVAMLLAGCVSTASPSPSDFKAAWLVTGPDPNGGACFTNYLDGSLVVDPVSGTAVSDSSILTTRVMWPSGYRARQVGAEVQVVRPDGSIVATTGNWYWVQGGYQGSVFYACGFVLPESSPEPDE